VSLEAYQTLCAAERAALPLSSRLGEGTPRVIQQQALQDTQLSLLRDAALAELAGWARAHDTPVVALKTAAHRVRLPSVDLDVLVPRDRIRDLLRFLDARGYRGFMGYVEDLSIHRVHAPVRAPPEGLSVEVHHELGDGLAIAPELWRSLREHQAFPGLFRLPPGREAWHLLWHSVVPHPHRRGQLGDLLLLAEALGDLGPGDRSQLHSLVASHPARDPLGRVLAMAEDLAAGRGPVDRFRAVAAMHYRLLRSRAFARFPDRAAKILEAQALELADGGRVGPVWHRLVAVDDSVPSARPWLYRVQRAIPFPTRMLRTLVRAGLFGMVLPLGARWGGECRAATR